jgi:hypothetical protein
MNCEKKCGQCQEFVPAKHGQGDRIRLLAKTMVSTHSLLHNPNTGDLELLTRLQHSYYTTDLSVTFGTVPRECNPAGGLVASNRICIK